MQFVVKYDPNLDIKNYHFAFHSPWDKLYGRDLNRYRDKIGPDIFKQLSRSKSLTSTKKVVTAHWAKTRDYLWSQEMERALTWFPKILNQDQDQIIKPLEKIYQQPFPFKKIFIYLTCFPRSPYDFKYRWFMVHRNTGLNYLFKTCLHELNHFMFYYYYQDKLKSQITNNQFEIIKEALAILTNPEGNDKPTVKALEDHIKTIQDQSIDTIIKSAINFINHGHFKDHSSSHT